MGESLGPSGVGVGTVGEVSVEKRKPGWNLKGHKGAARSAPSGGLGLLEAMRAAFGTSRQAGEFKEIRDCRSWYAKDRKGFIAKLTELEKAEFGKKSAGGPEPEVVDESEEDLVRLATELLEERAEKKKSVSWVELAPKGIDDNLRWRVWLLGECKRDPRLRVGLRGICKRDLLFWWNAFVYQFNPKDRLNGEVGPFLPWDFQDDCILKMKWCIDHGKDMVIEKSRQLGGSWMTLVVFLWYFLFHRNKTFLMMSKDEASVDGGDTIALFWKLDFILERLPGWMKPKRFQRKKLLFVNKDMNSMIFGKASTAKTGVGGTLTAMGIDEMCQIEDDYEVLRRTSDTADCRIFVSTHLGTETAFHELARRPGIRKSVLHWTMHPERRRGLYRYLPEKHDVEVLDKGYLFGPDFDFVRSEMPVGGPYPGLRSPWYDEQCIRKGSARGIAEDLDINPEGSVSQFFDAQLINQLIRTYSRPPSWEGDVIFDGDNGNNAKLVPKRGGPLKLWMVLGHDDRPPEDWYGAGADVATGIGATPSCFSLANARLGEKVLEYSNPWILPKDFAVLCVALCKLFRSENGEGAKFCWEKIGPGEVFGQRVIELGYLNVYMRTDEGQVAHKQSLTPGWYPGDKRTMLEEYHYALRTRQYINHSEPALKECLEFRYSKNGVEHSRENTEDLSGARANHGDLVIADGLCAKMVKGRQTKLEKERAPEIPYGSLAWRRQFHHNRRREEAWD